MLDKIETLEEVERKTSKGIGKFKPLNEREVYNPKKVKGFSLRNYKIGMEVIDKEKGKRAKGYFKSEQGYNSKYKNTKKHANHYGEYIAYIILQQLGKKACRVDLKRMAMKHPYSDKILQVEGVVSYLQKEENEVIIPARVIIERYKGAKITDREISNVELILEAFADMYKRKRARG